MNRKLNVVACFVLCLTVGRPVVLQAQNGPTLDVTGLPDDLVRPGSMVDLIGPGITLDEVARLAGTISYEILTRVGQRAQRRYLGGPDGTDRPGTGGAAA